MRITKGRIRRRIPAGGETRRVESRICQTRLKLLIEPCRRFLQAAFERVRTDRVGQSSLATGIRQRPTLGQRGGLVVKQTCAGIVLDDVATHPSIQLEHRVSAKRAGKRRRNVETVLALLLVLSRALLIDRVGRLEDGPCREDIQLNIRRPGQARIEPVKEVEHVPVRVERGDLWRVEESATGQSVNRDEIPHTRRASAERQRGRRRRERSKPQ